MPCAPSWTSALRTRSGSLAPVATITSAPAISSASTAVRGAARVTTTVSGTSAAPRTSWESSGRRASESKTIRRGWRVTPSIRGGQLRVVGQRGADPDHDRVDLGAPVVREPARVLARDPLRVAGAGRDLAVERHRRLEQHERAARARVLAERLVEQPRPRGELAVGDLDLDPLVAQDPEAAAGGLLGRVVGGDHDAGDAGLDDRVRARRRAAGVAARLERDVERRAAQVGPAGGGDRRALGVRPAQLGVEALAQRPGRRCTITAPTSGFGLVRPRPPSASSIARSRCSWSVA